MSTNNDNFYRTNKRTGLTLTTARDIMFLVLACGTFFFAFQWVQLNTKGWDETMAALIFSAIVGIVCAFFALLTIVRSKVTSNKGVKIGVPIVFGAAIFWTGITLFDASTLASLASIALGVSLGFGTSYGVDKVYQNSSLSFWKTIIVDGISSLDNWAKKAFIVFIFAVMCGFGYMTYYLSQTVVPEMATTVVQDVDEDKYNQAYQLASANEKERLETLETALRTHKEERKVVAKEANALVKDAIYNGQYATESRIQSWKYSKGWLEKQKDKGIQNYLADIYAAQEARDAKLTAYESSLSKKQKAYDNYTSLITGETAISKSIQKDKQARLSNRNKSLKKWTAVGSDVIFWALLLSGCLTPISMMWVRASGKQPRHSARETFSFFEIVGSWLGKSFNDAMEELADDLGVKDSMVDLDVVISSTPKQVKTKPKTQQTTQNKGLLDSVTNLFVSEPQLSVAGTSISIPANSNDVQVSSSPTPSLSKDLIDLECDIISACQSFLMLQNDNHHDQAGIIREQAVQLVEHYLQRTEQDSSEKSVLDFTARVFLFLNEEVSSPFVLDAEQNKLSNTEQIDTEQTNTEQNGTEQNNAEQMSTEQIELSTEQNAKYSTNEYRTNEPNAVQTDSYRTNERRTSTRTTAQPVVLDAEQTKKTKKKGIKPLPTQYTHGFELEGEGYIFWYIDPKTQNKTKKALRGVSGVKDVLSTNKKRLANAEQKRAEQIAKEGTVQKRTQNTIARNEAWVLFLTHAQEQLERTEQNAKYVPVLYKGSTN